MNPLLILVLILLFLTLLGLAGSRYEKRGAQRDFERLHPPGQRIQVGGSCRYLVTAGQRKPGQPLIVLESGMGDWSRAWADVMPALSCFARVIAYDRAGYGWSDPGLKPRTPERIVTELHALLAQAGERPPYLLVGHSMGSPLARLFYSRYPAEVAGMVWIDPVHENLPRYMPLWNRAMSVMLLFVRLGIFLARVGIIRLVVAPRANWFLPPIRDPQAGAASPAQIAPPQFFDNLLDETTEILRVENWSRAPRTLDDLPVISLEAQYPHPPVPFPPGLWRKFRAAWQSMHADQEHLSTDLRRIPAHTGHVVMSEQPELVIRVVREMMEKLTGEK